MCPHQMFTIVLGSQALSQHWCGHLEMGVHDQRAGDDAHPNVFLLIIRVTSALVTSHYPFVDMY